MKSTIAQLLAIYRPHKRRHKSQLNQKNSDQTSPSQSSVMNISLIAKKINSIEREKSMRSLSVKKRKEKHFFLKDGARSVEPPLLPTIKSTTPDIRTPIKSEVRFAALDLSLEDDMKKLDSIISRNHTARNDLLLVQKQIFDLGVNKLMKNKRFLSMYDGIENISLEQIDESLSKPSAIDPYQMDCKKSTFRRTRLPPIANV
ncbi:unnamed protein product [Blepharisma stoltei]|uniref:Uncharacterized protein n=1 Tax=Blepharisma stoltei TaxID=1481888 RepID=A0AAU9IDE8_9CILI|nr:unnamed protein product [Blepharisma stoltei]